MGGWIGPAILAAVIVGSITVAGWFVTSSLSLRAEDRKRFRRARDIQTALRVEVASELASLDADPDLSREEASKEESEVSSSYLWMPEMPASYIFEAVAEDVPILDPDVLGPLILYTNQRGVVAGMQNDIRSPAFAGLSEGEKSRFVREFLEAKRRLRDRGHSAADALASSL